MSITRRPMRRVIGFAVTGPYDKLLTGIFIRRSAAEEVLAAYIPTVRRFCRVSPIGTGNKVLS